MAAEQFFSPGPAVYMFCVISLLGSDVVSVLSMSFNPPDSSNLSRVVNP